MLPALEVRLLSLNQPRMQSRNGSCCPRTLARVPPRVLAEAGGVPLKGGRAWDFTLGAEGRPRETLHFVVVGGTLSFTHTPQSRWLKNTAGALVSSGYTEGHRGTEGAHDRPKGAQFRRTRVHMEARAPESESVVLPQVRSGGPKPTGTSRDRERPKEAWHSPIFSLGR